MHFNWYETEDTAAISLFVTDEAILAKEVNARREGSQLVVSIGTEKEAISIERMYTVSSVKVSPRKVEVILRKETPGRWRSLTAENPPETFIRLPEIPPDPEEEPLSNDAILDMFRKVYANASDEVKKTMNRSFLESKGKAISTNAEYSAFADPCIREDKDDK